MHQASFDFMQQHKERFDDKLMRERSEQVAGIPAGSDSAKVRSGQVGARQAELPADIAQDLDGVWTETVGEELGFPSYEALLGALRSERRVSAWSD